jgi:hypothetical protein
MRLRHVTTILVFLGISASVAYSQSVGNYTPAYTTGITYSSIASTGNVINNWRNNIANENDDNRSNPVNIGFDFWYLGIRYTTVSISTNGFIDFSGAIYDGNAASGPGVVTCGGAIAYRQLPQAFSTSGCAATPPTSYSGTYIALAPLYTDLWVSGGTAALANSLRTQTIGTAPNRIFIAEYINFDDFAAGVASFNFQVQLYESTGQIQFVYGTMTGSSGPTTTNYTIGINNSTMSATPTAAQLLVQQTENTATFSNVIQNTLTALPASNSMLSFTSVVPANPSGTLTFTGVGNTTMTLNWTDWATNELGYVIYSSTDGINYTFARQVAANSTSAAFSSLFGSTYFWKVYAVTEGTLSSPLSGSQATLNGGNFVSAQSGPWNTGSTWVGGAVPTPGDNATIASGHTVTIDGSNSITNVTVNGTLLVGNDGTARTFTVLGDMSISATGNFSSGSAATHSVVFGGNLINNGTLNLNPGGGSVTNATFSKNGNQTISGTGATTAFNLINMNLGTSVSNTLEVTSSNFAAPSDFITLNNGTFKFSVPTNAVTIDIFSVPVTIPSSCALYMNSPNSIMYCHSTVNLSGDLTINTGTVRVGDAADENLVSNGANLIINNGLLEIGGRLTRPSYISVTNFTMAGGTLIANKFGSNDLAPPSGTNAAGPFTIDVPGSKFNMTGGTIIIRQSGAGGAGNLGYINTNVTNYLFSAGTIQIGDALTPAGNTMSITTDNTMANLLVNTTNGPTAQLTANLTVSQTVNIGATATLNCANKNLTIGGNFNNDGTYTPGTNTTTFNGTTAISGASVTTFNNVSITGSLAGHPVAMSVNGNWANNGTYTPNGGTVSFISAGNQTINGTSATQTFFNLTVNKTGGTLSTAGGVTTLTIQNNYTQSLGNFTPVAGGTINVGGNWEHDAGTFTPNTNTVIFNGTGAQTIGSTTLTTETFYKLTVNKAAATQLNTGGTITTITVTSNFAETQGDFAPPATLNVAGNWNHDAGNFIPGTGTVVFFNNVTQVASSAALTTETFYNLTINKNAGTTLSTAATFTTFAVANNYLNTQGNFTAPATMTVGGNVTLTAGTFTAGTLVDLKGNWAHNGGTFTAGSSTVSFSGSAAQTLSSATAAEIFFNLTINKAAGTLLSMGANPTTLTVQNNFTESQGDFTPPATMNVGANWEHDAGTFTPGTGTVTFNGGTPGQIASTGLTSETFYNLTINKTAGVLLTTGGTLVAITVSNNYVHTQGNFTAPATLTFNVNATLTAGTLTAGTSIISNGNWGNNGGTFNPAGGTVTFSGTGAQLIGGSAVTQTFFNVIINKTAGQTLSTVGTTTLTFQNNYTQTSGNFTAPTTVNVGGNWEHDAGTFTPGAGTVIFNGTAAQQIASTTLPTEVFNNFTVNKTAGSQLSTGGTITAITVNAYVETQGDFLAPPTLTINANTTLTAGNLTSGATVISNGNWTNNGGTFIPGTGTVTFSGTAAQAINGTAIAQTFYNVTITKTVGQTLSLGGSTTSLTIQNNYTQTQGNFTALALSTINVGGNWEHDAGTFTPSTSTVLFNGAGAQQILSTTLTIETFYNLMVNKTAGTLLNTGGTIITLTVTNNFAETQGDFTPPATMNVGGNWNHDSGTFTPGGGTVVFNLGQTQQISSAALTTETFNNLTVSKTAGTNLSAGGTIVAIVVNGNYVNTQGIFTAPATLTFNGNATFAAGSVVAGALIISNGNWTNNGGTFTPGVNTVTFTGAGLQVIGGTAATQTFYNVTLNKPVGQIVSTGGSTTTLTFQNNYLETLGSFVAPTTVNVGGNWEHDGDTFVPGAGTVNFNGSGPQTIGSTAFATETFNNVVVNKTAGTLLNTGGVITAMAVNNYTNTQGNFNAPTTMSVAGNATLTSGTLTAGTLIDIKGNWTNNGGTFAPGTGTVSFTGTGAQAINGTAGAQTFYNVLVNKTAGQTLTNSGSTTNLTILNNYTQTQGNFTAIALGIINIGGNWEHDAGTFTPSTGTVNFNGTGGQLIGSTTLTTETFYKLTINMAAGTLLTTTGAINTITVSNNYTQTLGDFTPPATLNVGGNWTHDAGAFNPGTGTVVFISNSAQQMSSATIATETLYNMTINKTGSTLNSGGGGALSAISVANNFTETAGNYTMGAISMSVGGNVLLTAGTFTGGILIDVKGNWTNNGGTFTPTTSTVQFSGTGIQLINGTAATQTFYNVTINKTAAQSLATSGSTTTLTIQNNYTETQGDFIAPAAVNVAGNWQHDAGNFTPGAGTVTFNGAGAEQIASANFTSETFFNLTVNKTVATQLSTGGLINAITVSGNYVETKGDFAAPATFAIVGNTTLTAGTFTAGTLVDEKGNWTDNGGVFVPGTGTIQFTGAGAQTISGTLATQTFYDLLVNKTAATLLNVGGSTATITLQDYTNTQGNFTSPASFIVVGNVTLNAGTFTAGANVNVGGDWKMNGATFVPGVNTVTFNSSSVQQNITGTSATTFGKLAINNTFATSPQVTLAFPTTVNSQLTMTAGILQTSAATTLIMASGSTSNLGSSASFVSGPMQYNMAINNINTTLNFPLGKSGLYGAAALTVRHTSATSYSYTAEIIPSSAGALGYTLDPTTERVSGLRYWLIQRGLTASPLVADNTGLTTAGVNAPRLTLNYVAADQVTDPANLTIVKTKSAVPNTWFAIGGTASGTPAGSIAMSVSSPNFDSFSDFTFANLVGGTNTLPIELVSFTGKQNGSKIDLAWKTASELRNDHFEVEKSADGETFTLLGKVKGAGTTTQASYYAIDDYTPITGPNYYRLKQVDINGSYTYSNVIAVNFERTPEFSVVVFPNPVENHVVGLLMETPTTEGAVFLNVVDMNGRNVAAQQLEADGNLSREVSWSLPGELASGVYILQARQNAKTITVKLIIH